MMANQHALCKYKEQMEEIFVGSVQAVVKEYHAYKDNIIAEPVFLAKK